MNKYAVYINENENPDYTAEGVENYTIKVNGSWEKVSFVIFRSWCGPRRLNGEKYLGPRYMFMTDEPISSTQATRED